MIFIRFFAFLGLLRTIAMNLNLGICREEEKQAKKHALIDYLLRHLKVFIKFKHHFKVLTLILYSAP